MKCSLLVAIMSRFIAANRAVYAPILVVLQLNWQYNETFYMDYLWTGGLIHTDSFEDISSHEARRQPN